MRGGALDAVDAVLAAAGQDGTMPRGRSGGLTEREVEVLCQVARGRSNKEISAHLGISPKTVRNHVEHVYTKLGVKNRIGAGMYALEHGLLLPDS